MAAPTTPVAIGTRGTIGSLVRKEIEYFTKIESQKYQPHFVNMVSNRSYSSTSKPSFWVLLMTGKRRKRRSTANAQVAESNDLNNIPGYNYRILKDDINHFQF